MKKAEVNVKCTPKVFCLTFGVHFSLICFCVVFRKVVGLTLRHLSEVGLTLVQFLSEVAVLAVTSIIILGAPEV